MTYEKWKLFLDYDLDPGNGTGLEFLDWILTKQVTTIDQIVITSFSKEMSQKMYAMCRKAMVVSL
jgi:hypothetical protein